MNFGKSNPADNLKKICLDAGLRVDEKSFGEMRDYCDELIFDPSVKKLIKLLVINGQIRRRRC